jgi:hypothetical protein
MFDIEKYWLFVSFCLAVGLLLMRLVLRERITLQGSLSYLLFLAVLVLFAVFPGAAGRLAHSMGFTLMSNFFFAVTAAMFALLHLTGLIAHSRAELRTITLVQEIAILREKVDALSARVDEARASSNR